MSLQIDGALSSPALRRDPAGTVRRSPLPHGPRPVRLRRPPAPRWSDGTLLWALGTYVAVLVGIWAVHGGAAGFSDGAAGIALALTQLTGLAASAAGLLGLVLVARPMALERRVGLDRMFVWHRILGETMGLLVGAHVAAGVLAWSAGGRWWDAVRDLSGRQPYFAGAAVGAALIGVVTVSSLRAIRSRLAYETWWFLHLTAYLAFGLSFGHTIVAGSDFANDAVARTAWIGLHVAVALALIVGRWGRTLLAVATPLRVASIERASDDVSVVHLAGRNADLRRGAAGQFCILRPLTREGWWHANPFSLSAAPTSDGLRFSIKHRGDASGHLSRLPVGTRVAVEGPFGVTIADVLVGTKTLFVVGGVGIAPVRALLEDLPGGSQPVVLYRARHERDLVHLDELQALTALRGGHVMTLVGPSAGLAVRDPFSAAALRRAVPDVARRTAVLCGPDRLVHAARRGLRAAGVPDSSVHFEHAWW